MGLCCLHLTAFGQNLNTEINNGKQAYLLGKIDKSGLQGPNYNGWFETNYNNYSPDASTINNLSGTIADYEILLFMGTWCGDSKREVPRFLKVLDELQFPDNQLTMVALSREAGLYKQSPQHEEAGLNIHRVPTFIIYKNGKEINRIMEEPVESLEKDLLQIVSTNSYEGHYAVVQEVHTVLQKGVSKLKRKENKLLKSYQDKVSSMYELNTYAKVLNHSQKTEEAIAVLELNTKFFPDNPKVYVNLYQMLKTANRTDEAVVALEKAVELDPKNKQLQSRLNQIKSR